MAVPVSASPLSSEPSRARDDRPRWRTVAWEGEIDLEVAPAVLARTLEAASGSEDTVVVDLQLVQFMDAAGLDALLRARSHLGAEGRALYVRNPPRTTRWMLDLFDLTDLIEPTPCTAMTAGSERSDSGVFPPSGPSLPDISAADFKGARPAASSSGGEPPA